MNIHPTAIISKGAELGDVEIGPYSFIGQHVNMGDGTIIGPYVFIDGHTEIGKNNKILQYSSIGSPPQDLKYKNEPTRLVIGNGNLIREHVTINTGTVTGHAITTIGNGNLFMINTHIAHDCIIGDETVFANNATLAGHVTVESRAIIGGLVAIHQFTRIGTLAMIGGGAMVTMDVVPFAIASGDRARLYGINTIGLRRRGFSKEKIRLIDKIYRILFRSNYTLGEGIKKVKADITDDPDIKHIIEFIETSIRGVCRYRI